MSNQNLSEARRCKNDEFYTRIEDIENEILNHPECVEAMNGKSVYMNCDNPYKSNFVKFFTTHFKELHLASITATNYSESSADAYKMHWEGDYDADGRPLVNISHLEGNGDFRSQECIEILKKSDIICTNPPFSHFREYIAQIMKYNKKFLIIGSINAIAYKEVFPLIKNNKMHLGYERQVKFTIPSGDIKNIATYWYTNLSTNKSNGELHLTKNYKGNEDKYPKYDNYDAINCNRTADIPKDYYGIIGVPISFMEKYCPEQFEIIGMAAGWTQKQMPKSWKQRVGYNENIYFKSGTRSYGIVNGVQKYHRILIKRKVKNM